jgi:RNA-dependent RNA polymerase
LFLGDYDGDKGVLIWQPELVQPFINAPLDFSKEPAGIADYFSRNNETVSDFLMRTASAQSTVRIHEVQQYLLGAIRDTTVVGRYSIFHDNAIYTLGYTDPQTIRLAYMLVQMNGFLHILLIYRINAQVLQDAGWL